MKYDDVEIPYPKKLGTDFLVGVVMLGVTASVLYGLNYLLGFALKESQVVTLFLFLFFAPALVGGVALGKYIVFRFFIESSAHNNTEN